MANVIDELIEMRGLRFHYRDWASKRVGAPDLVLLHGYTSHARSWDSFAEAMTDRWRWTSGGMAKLVGRRRIAMLRRTWPTISWRL